MVTGECVPEAVETPQLAFLLNNIPYAACFVKGVMGSLAPFAFTLWSAEACHRFHIAGLPIWYSERNSQEGGLPST